MTFYDSSNSFTQIKKVDNNTPSFCDIANLSEILIKNENLTTILPQIGVLVLGTLWYVLILPFLVFDIKILPFGRIAAVLFGSVLMTVTLVLSQDEVYEELGKKSNLETLALLIGMMIITHYLDREGILARIIVPVMKKERSFFVVLWVTCFLTALVASFVTNDAACVMLTPFLLSTHHAEGRNKLEYLPLLLGIATSSNIGSAATIMGNPQNAYIAATLNINLLHTLLGILPAVIIGLIINTSLLTLYTKIYFIYNDRKTKRKGAENAPILGIYDERDKNVSNAFKSFTEKAEDRAIRSVRTMTTSVMPDNQVELNQTLQQSWVGVYADNFESLNQRNVIGKVSGAKFAVAPCKVCLVTPSYNKIFWVIIGVAILVTIILLSIPPNVVEFNLGLIPIGVSAILLIIDGVLNKRSSTDTVRHVDWGVILLFCGLFVWSRGFQKTKIPKVLFLWLKDAMQLNTFGGVLLFTSFIMIGSNLVSNVPLVILFIDYLQCLGPVLQNQQTTIGLLLAWIATIAGNFTLIGSVANLIVAEKAKSEVNYTLNFFAYLAFGFPSTLIIIFTGLPIVYFIGQILPLKINT